MSSSFATMSSSAAASDASSHSASFSYDDVLHLLGMAPTRTEPPSSPAAPSTPTLEYLFEDDEIEVQQQSLGSRICYNAGVTYLLGLGAGGLWGLAEGLNGADAKTARLKLNLTLNAITRRGPLLGNNLGALAVLYSVIHGGTLKALHRQQDLASTAGSAAVAGALFRCTAGLKQAALASALLSASLGGLELFRNWGIYAAQARHLLGEVGSQRE